MAATSTLAARAAWLHLVEKKTNIEIADLLGVSRLRVPALVRWAEQNGVVSIELHPPTGADWDAAELLRKEFGLAEALVSPSPGVPAVARIGARYLREVLVEGAVLGIAWGSGTQAVVEELEQLAGLPQCDIVQLIGGIPQPDTAWHATELLVRLTAVLGGSAAALLSPMIVPDVDTARGLRDEPSIACAFAQMDRVDVALLGIGAWRPGGSRIAPELGPADLTSTRDVVADACGILLDAAGDSIHIDLTERIMSIDEGTLRARPVRIGLAVGERKVDAIRAVLRSGLLTVFATDSATAGLLLRGT
jgi:DNA-binding transcriptional regulator LsrR (DeoR family)